VESFFLDDLDLTDQSEVKTAIRAAYKTGLKEASSYVTRVSDEAISDIGEIADNSFTFTGYANQAAGNDEEVDMQSGLDIFSETLKGIPLGVRSAATLALEDLVLEASDYVEILKAIHNGGNVGLGSQQKKIKVLLAFPTISRYIESALKMKQDQVKRAQETKFRATKAGQKAAKLAEVLSNMKLQVPAAPEITTAAPVKAVTEMLRMFQNGRGTQLTALKMSDINALFNIYYASYDPARLDLDEVTEDMLTMMGTTGNKSVTADTPLYHEILTINELIELNIDLNVWQALSGRKLSGFATRVFEMIRVNAGAISNISTFKTILKENTRIDTGVDVL
jgi:hypothetical protein